MESWSQLLSQLLAAALVTVSLSRLHTWGPLGLLLNSSTTSILCLGLTEPSTTAYFRPSRWRCTATTFNILVHWETTTLERVEREFTTNSECTVTVWLFHPGLTRDKTMIQALFPTANWSQVPSQFRNRFTCRCSGRTCCVRLNQINFRQIKFTF